MNKQNLSDLNGYLFEQLERLNDEELSEKELKKEINRAKAITSVADKIISNADVVLKAQITYGERLATEKPKLLE